MSINNNKIPLQKRTLDQMLEGKLSGNKKKQQKFVTYIFIKKKG